MRKNIVLTILMVLSACAATAQWRLDADVRLGRTNIDHTIPFEQHSIGLGYSDAFSFGVDLNIGRELNRGWALYSGLTYDLMRFDCYDRVVYLDGGHKHDPGMHRFSFLTVPVRVEYRFFKDIIRPYAGVGASFMCSEHNPTERFKYNYSHNRVVPTTMFGLNLEYKRFIVGFSKRIDLIPFWKLDDLEHTWRIAQTTVKIGYRIF